MYNSVVGLDWDVNEISASAELTSLLLAIATLLGQQEELSRLDEVGEIAVVVALVCDMKVLSTRPRACEKQRSASSSRPHSMCESPV
jgi:hypothetical protein